MDEQSERIYFSDKCYLDCRNRELYYDGKLVPVKIRPLDYKIIHAMSRNPGLFTYDGLIEACWSLDAQTRGVDYGTVRQHIRAIRNWHPDVEAVIDTIVDVGYKYLGPKCGTTPSAPEKADSKPQSKFVKTPIALVNAALTTSTPNGQFQNTERVDLLEQLKNQVASGELPSLELLTALKDIAEGLTQYGLQIKLAAWLEVFIDKYRETNGLSGDTLLRLEQVFFRIRRKVLERDLSDEKDRLEAHRIRQDRASENESIEKIEALNKDTQDIDSNLAQISAELGRSSAYKIEFGG